MDKELQELYKEHGLDGNGYVKAVVLANILGVSKATIRNWIVANKIKAVLFSNAYFMKKKDAREFIMKKFLKINNESEYG